MPFQIPSTINDENEWSLPGLPFYVTNKEFSLIFVAATMSYVGAYPIVGGSLLNLAVAAIAFMIGAALVKREKKKHPAGWPWLWDKMLTLGLRPQRGLIKYSKSLVWLSMHHVPRPALFLTGASQSGSDLTVSAPWQLITPPATQPARMVPPRRRRVYDPRTPSPAPPWFAHADGYRDVVEPTIPISIRWEVSPDELPGQTRPN